MASFRSPDLVKPVVGLLYGLEPDLEPALEALELQLGRLEYVSPAHPFEVSDYYRAELGTRPMRRFAAARRLISPGQLAFLKRRTHSLERSLARDGRRTVNLDPGYMDYGKLVLASMKPGSQKIYLGRGVWADLMLLRNKGRWDPLPWSFPDFRAGIYDADLDQIRLLYRAQMRGA